DPRPPRPPPAKRVRRGSRTAPRRRHIHKTLIDLSELARECLELARTRTHLDEKALRFVESLDRGRRPMILGDADELRAAISNLIDNAIKYSDGKVDVSVEGAAPAAMDDKRVTVRVTDRGAGGPHDELKRIFNRFYRAPRRVASRVKGAGLGLFIVRSIVSKHGGKTFAESEGEGMGSVFTIELPRIENGAVRIRELNLSERAR